MTKNSLFARSTSWVFLFALLTLGGIDSAHSFDGKSARADRKAGVSAPARQRPAAFKSAELVQLSLFETLAEPLVLEPDPPALCEGQGELGSIARTDWESGLGGWTVGTRDIANPDTFDTPDWAVVGGLPDGRPGSAAFVANLDLGDCDQDVETGALMLDSPPIQIPPGTLVPRVAVDHWVATELGWDGGNLKISVNGGVYRLIPESAFEFNPYNGTLFTAGQGNTNPMAGEDAFTGADDGDSGSWGQSHINLFGIVEANDTIRLRFDFGVDDCSGLIGWYVDDVQVYSCAEELPPSECGDSILEAGEQCDDGNTANGDGCSNACQIEDGWQCTDPTPPGEVADPGFEAGTPNPFWTESSTNYGTPICDEAECGTGAGSGPADGLFWAWFGGTDVYEEASVSQAVVIPSESSELRFELEVSACDSALDYLEVLVDGNREYFIDGSSMLCGDLGYTTQTVDISAYADDESHDIEFHSEVFANGSDVSDFFVDSVRIPGGPSICTQNSLSLTLRKEVVNDDGGTAQASDWTLSAAGPTPFSGSGPSVSSGEGFAAGTYDLSESGGPNGYTASDWVCVGGTQDDADTVTLAEGDNVTCTITNDDIALANTSLTLVKEVVNDDGGSAEASDWTLSAAGPTPFSGSGPSVSSGEGFAAGTYDLSESGGPNGYIASDWVCVGGTQDDADTVTLAAGDSATCTITNNDVPPGTRLTLVKEVVNDDGGTAQASDWTLSAAGPTPFSGSGPSVSSGEGFSAGTYDLSESGGPAGYTASDWFCVGATQNDADTVTVAEGESVTCTITNDDIRSDFQINAGQAGAWFNPATSGQGVLIDVRPEDKFMFVAWFTYTDADSENPFEHRWLTAQGNYVGDTAELVVYETLGGRFDDPQAVTTTPIGELSLSFSDCRQGEATYAIDAEGLQGGFPLTRVIPGSDNTCEELDGIAAEAVDINAGMDGAWYDPVTSGQGFLIDSYPDPVGGNFMFVAWFTFGDDTASGLRWLTAQGNFDGSTADLELSETTGGSFDDPRPPSTVTVGTLDIDFTDCSNAQLTYSLTDEGLEGDIAIQRVIPGSQALCEGIVGTE